MGSDELRMAFLLACVWFHGPPSNSQEKEEGGGACRLSAAARDHRGLAPASCQYGARVGCCNSAVFGIASKCNRLVWFLLLQKRRRKNLRQVYRHLPTQHKRFPETRLSTFIPKSFVRLIIHCCLCAKIATYLQNIGRGGRDDASRMATHPFGDLAFILVQILTPATLQK